MKSRHKKYIQRVLKNSPVIGFSLDGEMKKKGQVEDLSNFQTVVRLDAQYIDTPNFKKYKAELITQFFYSFDHHIFGGLNRFVYLLVPAPGGYRIVEKESLQQWSDAHWKRVDPKGEREWMYFDEDTAELFNYMVRQFERKCP